MDEAYIMDMLDKGMIHALWKSKRPSMELYHGTQQKHNLKLEIGYFWNFNFMFFFQTMADFMKWKPWRTHRAH